MKYDNRHSAREANTKYVTSDVDSPSFWGDYPNLKEWESGNHILIQYETEFKENKEYMLSRPLYAVYVGASVWDQALVIHFVENKRAWMLHCEVRNSKDSKYYTKYLYMDPEIETIQLWTDNIRVLGWWKCKPTLGQLKQALDPLYRPIKVNNIITNYL